MVVAAQMPQAIVTQMRGSPTLPGMEALAHTIPYDNQVMGDTMSGSPAPVRRWATLRTATLVLDGGASSPSMRNAARLLAETLPNAEARTLPGQGHGADPAVLSPVLAEFFGR